MHKIEILDEGKNWVTLQSISISMKSSIAEQALIQAAMTTIDVASVESQKLFKKIRSDFFGCRRTQIEVNLEKLARSVCASRRKKHPNLFEEFMRLDTSPFLYSSFIYFSLPTLTGALSVKQGHLDGTLFHISIYWK